jgi:hypothetical protein
MIKTVLAALGAVLAMALVWGALALLVVGLFLFARGVWDIGLWWWVAVLVAVVSWRFLDADRP